MGVFKRALVQVRANLGKSILIFIIFLMTFGAVSATFVVTRMYNKTVDETFKEGVVPVTIWPEENMGSFGLGISFDEYKQISYEQYQKVEQLDQVESTDISFSMSISGDELEYPDEFSQEMAGSYYVEFSDEPQKTEQAYSDGVYKYDFDMDEYKSNPNSIIINDEVLAANGLSVGDKITLDLNSLNSNGGKKAELEDQELTIAGTYSITPTQEMIEETKKLAQEYSYEVDLAFTDLKTMFMMPYAKGEEIANVLKDEPDAIYSTFTYSLSSLEVKDQFETDAEALIGMPLSVDFNIFSQGLNETAESLSKVTFLKTILDAIVGFIVVVILVLLIVIITLFIRGRKKEIGILVALGETKRNIYVQLLIEQFILLGAAILIEYPVVLIYLNSLAEKNSVIALGFDLIPFGQSILVGVIIVGIITIIPAIYTLRVKPKKILL